MIHARQVDIKKSKFYQSLLLSAFNVYSTKIFQREGVTVKAIYHEMQSMHTLVSDMDDDGNVVVIRREASLQYT